MQEERLAGIFGTVPLRRIECRHQPGVGVHFLHQGDRSASDGHRLRRKGIPIASSGSGYFYAATEQEVRATIAHLTRRISGIAAAISGLNRSLEQFDTAQTRLPLEGGDVVE